MIDGEADELPAFVGMTILTAALRTFAHNTPCGQWHCHVSLIGVARRVPDD
jgi:hypothetical protein